MAERWTRREALHQAIALAVIVAIAGAGLVYAHGRPQARAALKAEVSVLRSQAAEAALVLESARHLNERFWRAHLEQLGQNVAREQESIATLRLEPSLGEAQRFADGAARRLQEALHEATDGDVTSRPDAPRVIAGELQVLERALHR